ncbi:MAG: biotin--[acetyl-CoA-carboxylase] ligase [Armatimonadetes bacterium]|nr:biotin--[acetyl-CoA-carboxylase] ligase [Armatimonadota bacterium]
MSGTGMTGAQPLGRPTIRVEELESTNDLARLLAAAGLPEGTAVVASRQTRGRGRFGRAWVSPHGGLWCSILLRPVAASGWGRLSLAMAVAVAEAIDQAAGVRSRIRWPNDILVAGRKVAGVLLEGAAEAVVVGVGINANNATDTMPAALRTMAGSLRELAGRTVSLEALFEILLARGAGWYEIWAQGGPEVIDAWSARDATRGTRVAVDTPAGRLAGVADGVDGDGALRIVLEGGEVRRVLAGDLYPTGRAAEQEAPR